MNKAEITRIKKAGAENAIREGIHSKLWTVQQDLDGAVKDRMKDFRRFITSAKNKIADAESLYNELSE